MAAFPGSVASTAGHTAWRLGRSLVQHGWDAVGAWEHGPRGAADWERSAGGGPIRLTGPFSPGVVDSGLRHRRGRRCGLAPGKPGVKAQPQSLLRVYRRSWRLCCDRQAASNTGPGRLTGCVSSATTLCVPLEPPVYGRCRIFQVSQGPPVLTDVGPSVTLQEVRARLESCPRAAWVPGPRSPVSARRHGSPCLPSWSR